MENALNSPLLQQAVVLLYNTPAFQKALQASPTIDEFKKMSPYGNINDWMHWTEGTPPSLVTYVGTIVSTLVRFFFVNSLTYGQICICYQEWEAGRFTKIKLTNDDHYNLFYDISERINADFLDVRYKEVIRARFRKWARSSNMVLV